MNFLFVQCVINLPSVATPGSPGIDGLLHLVSEKPLNVSPHSRLRQDAGKNRQKRATEYQGCRIWALSASVWPQMGQSREFFRGVFKYTKIRSEKSPGFVPFGANLTHYVLLFDIPAE